MKGHWKSSLPNKQIPKRRSSHMPAPSFALFCWCGHFLCCCNKMPWIQHIKTIPTYLFFSCTGLKSSGLSWVLCLGSHKAWIRASAGMGSYLEAVEEELLPSSFRLFSSVQFSRSVMSDSWRPHEPQHARPPCPSPTPRVHPNPCPLSQWCHPSISSSVVPFSCCPQTFPASGSFQMSQFFASGGQSIGVSTSASVLPMNTQDWSPWIQFLLKVPQSSQWQHTESSQPLPLPLCQQLCSFFFY